MQTLDVPGFDEVVRLECAGAPAFIALHAVLGGHAFGGIRVRAYPSDDDALADALALAQAMSRKVVLAGITGGGAKTVLTLPAPDRRARALAELGAFIESLGGRYQCGPDYGFTAADGAELRRATRHVASGDLAAATARGALLALLALGEPRVVAVQGLGEVGRPLAEALVRRGARVIASEPRWPADLSPAIERVELDAIYDVECDVFAPCAHGGVLDARTIPRLRAAAVCGAANNPFAGDDDADRLHARRIDYVPDVIANAGATIVGASTILGEAPAIDARMAALPALAKELVARAREEGRSAHHLARELADQRIAALRASSAATPSPRPPLQLTPDVAPTMQHPPRKT